MSVEIRVPSLGESIVDATIRSWLKKEGDPVKRGDALVELETDKVNVDVPAEQDGVLQKIMRQVDDVVAVGDVIGVLGEEGEVVKSNGAVTPKGDVASANGSSTGKAAVQQTASQNTVSPTDVQRPPSPLARRIAAEYNVDIAQVKGSSPHGRVTRDDVISYLEQNVQGGGTNAVSAAMDRPSTPLAPSRTGASPVPTEVM